IALDQRVDKWHMNMPAQDQVYTGGRPGANGRLMVFDQLVLVGWILHVKWMVRHHQHTFARAIVTRQLLDPSDLRIGHNAALVSKRSGRVDADNDRGTGFEQWFYFFMQMTAITPVRIRETGP